MSWCRSSTGSGATACRRAYRDRPTATPRASDAATAWPSPRRGRDEPGDDRCQLDDLPRHLVATTRPERRDRPVPAELADVGGEHDAVEARADDRAPLARPRRPQP